MGPINQNPVLQVSPVGSQHQFVASLLEGWRILFLQLSHHQKKELIQDQNTKFVYEHTRLLYTSRKWCSIIGSVNAESTFYCRETLLMEELWL